MTDDKRATAKQWKALGSFAKHMGFPSASALAGHVLDRAVSDVRQTGLTTKQASRVITVAAHEQKEQEHGTRDTLN